MNKRVLIIGLGLIGSSLALCIKKKHPDTIIIGLDKHKTSEEVALNRKIIDQKATSLVTESEKADIILLCSPVNSILKQLKELATLNLKQSVIISDVGSTKMKISSLAAELNLSNFVGGHPMAGSHKSGVTAADEHLFENAYYIFTGISAQQQENVRILKELLKGTQAKFVLLSAKEHDDITGMLSHLPHIIAAGLVNQSKLFNEEHPRSRQLAAGGFRDITRIASSDPEMWTDILLSNKQALIHLLQDWETEMMQISRWIKEENREAIFSFFSEARETRKQMPIHKEGAIPAFHDLVVDIPDKAGVIAEITGILGEANLSLINIKILETREDIYGILQLTFKRFEDLKIAKKLIKQKTAYNSYEK